MIIVSVLISIGFGFVVDLFFRLVKHQGDFSGYISVGDFVSDGVSKKWIKYLIFRLIPPIIIFILLNSILLTKLEINNRLAYLLLCAFISLSFRDVIQLFKREILINNKIVHFLNIILVLTCSVIVSFMPEWLINYVSPNFSDIVNSFWASLLLALIILFYYDSVSLNKKKNETDAIRQIKTNYIKSSYDFINSKFNDDIAKYCTENNCSKPLLYSILIFENMNRPRIFRIMENLLVRLFRLNLTIGIAQIKSSRLISDKESIGIASKILKDSRIINEIALQAQYPMHEKLIIDETFIKFIKKYNKNQLYAQWICEIMEEMRNFKYEIFQESN